MIFVVIAAIIAVLALVYFLFFANKQEQKVQLRKYTLDELEQAPISIISAMPEGGALGTMTKHGVVYNYTQQQPAFVHTLNSYWSCAYVVTFLMLAEKAGIFKLGLFQEAMGFKENQSGWDFAKSVKDWLTPAATVAIPVAMGTILSATALLAAPVAAVAGLIGVLAGLDGEIKRRITESQICNVFVEEFVKAYSLPPTGVLNALVNLWIAPRYGVIKGGGSAMDRTDEYGIGIIRDMAFLGSVLATREKILHGVGTLGDGKAYKSLVNGKDIKTVLYNYQEQLKKSRLSPKWTRYCFSFEFLFAYPNRAKWTGDPIHTLQEACRNTYKRTGNMFLFDRQSMIEWMERGGVWKGYMGGNPNPATLFFDIGHDPGIDGYGGLDFSLFGLANQATPNVAEKDWKVNFDISTAHGWMYVS